MTFMFGRLYILFLAECHLGFETYRTFFFSICVRKNLSVRIPLSFLFSQRNILSSCLAWIIFPHVFKIIEAAFQMSPTITTRSLTSDDVLSQVVIACFIMT
jgi:hypothetical protein